MNKRVREDLKSTFTASIGWLFADMLLVLTILFLASSTFVQSKTLAKHTPTQMVTVTVKPVPEPTVAHLDKVPCDFTLHNLDYNGLLQNPAKASAVKDAEQKVKAQPCLQQRRTHQAGLVLAFGGAVTSNNTLQPTVGQQIAGRIEDVVLTMLGEQEHFVFFKDTVYDAYHDLAQPYGTVELRVYLFA